LGLFFLIGFINDKHSPGYYEAINENYLLRDTIAYNSNFKYFCPRVCDVNHIHRAHPEDFICVSSDSCNHYLVKKLINKLKKRKLWQEKREQTK